MKNVANAANSVFHITPLCYLLFGYLEGLANVVFSSMVFINVHAVNGFLDVVLQVLHAI